MRRKRKKIALQTKENFLAVFRKIHFVDGRNDAANSQKRGDISVPMRLGEQALGGVHQNDRKIGRGGAGGHVARVLFVARRVRYDKLASRRAKVTVSDINGDSLFALGAQAIGQQRKIERPSRTVDLALLHRSDLVFVDGFRVMKQSPDQRGLAIIHAARGGKAQKVLAEVLLKECG